MTLDILGFIPARGGSKSIPLKNLARIGGATLLEYAINAAGRCPLISRIVCSTDHEEIAKEAYRFGVDVDYRPTSLADDEANVLDVVKEYIARENCRAEIVVLFQPTNPFVRSSDVEKTLQGLILSEQAKTAQTIAPVPHNYHAWNQRELKEGLVKFKWEKDRLGAFNKQRKPNLYKFGNLVAVRTAALSEMEEFFAEPSVGIEIQSPYDLDVDGPSDLLLAEALFSSGLVDLTDRND